jgi:hypothetical protein
LQFHPSSERAEKFWENFFSEYVFDKQSS